MKRKTRRHLIEALVGLTAGGVIFTWIGKTVLEIGATVLTGVAVVGSGFIIGALTLPARLLHR